MKSASWNRESPCDIDCIEASNSIAIVLNLRADKVFLCTAPNVPGSSRTAGKATKFQQPQFFATAHFCFSFCSRVQLVAPLSLNL